MTESPGFSRLIRKFQTRVAEAVLVLGGPSVVGLVCAQMRWGRMSVTGGSITANEDIIGFYLMNGIAILISLCALAISTTATRRLIKDLRSKA